MFLFWDFFLKKNIIFSYFFLILDRCDILTQISIKINQEKIVLLLSYTDPKLHGRASNLLGCTPFGALLTPDKKKERNPSILKT